MAFGCAKLWQARDFHHWRQSTMEIHRVANSETTTLSMFSGVGGLDIGWELATGSRVVGYCERDATGSSCCAITTAESEHVIDWQRVTLNIRSSGLALSTAARMVGSDGQHLSRLARGDVRQPRFDVGVRLLDLHLERDPDSHGKMLWGNE